MESVTDNEKPPQRLDNYFLEYALVKEHGIKKPFLSILLLLALLTVNSMRDQSGPRRHRCIR